MNQNKFWEKEFGTRESAKDFAGRAIEKSAYGKEQSSVGWDFDHICAIANSGDNAEDNMQIANIVTNREKADKPVFTANGKLFKVRKNPNKIGKKNWAGGYNYSQKKYCIVEDEK
jgi:hypothetical protein